MSIGTLLLTLSVALIVSVFIARPFLRPVPKVRQLTEQDALSAEKEALLAQIQALDFDAETSKQDPETYLLEREQLMGQAAEVLRELDRIDALSDRSVQAEIEAAVATLRGLIPCPSCDTMSRPSDNFCATCGEPLS